MERIIGIKTGAIACTGMTWDDALIPVMEDAIRCAQELFFGILNASDGNIRVSADRFLEWLMESEEGVQFCHLYMCVQPELGCTRKAACTEVFFYAEQSWESFISRCYEILDQSLYQGAGWERFDCLMRMAVIVAEKSIYLLHSGTGEPARIKQTAEIQFRILERGL